MDIRSNRDLLYTIGLMEAASVETVIKGWELFISMVPSTCCIWITQNNVRPRINSKFTWGKMECIVIMSNY